MARARPIGVSSATVIATATGAPLSGGRASLGAPPYRYMGDGRLVLAVLDVININPNMGVPAIVHLPVSGYVDGRTGVRARANLRSPLLWLRSIVYWALP